jgi:hypothetical protein
LAFSLSLKLSIIHIIGKTGHVEHAVLADRRGSDWGVITGPSRAEC